jgi:mono/diheme cytochrome c family protein
MRNGRTILALTLVACTIPAATAAADSRAGRAFARENCSRCHAIDRVGASPLGKAPPFRDIARRYKIADLEEALAEGIVTGHPGMPEFELTPRQIDDLLAHMRRLRGRR